MFLCCRTSPCLFLSISLILTVCAKGQTQDQHQMHVGVNTHFAQSKGIISENLNMIANAGVTHIRDIIRWADVEKQRGEYSLPDMTYLDEANKRKLNVLLILAYGNPLYENGDKPRIKCEQNSVSIGKFV